MAWKHITASGSANVGVAQGTPKLTIQVNAALTGSITVADTNGTVGIITNPTVGSYYEYWDLVGQATVNPSTTTDITVNTESGRRK